MDWYPETRGNRALYAVDYSTLFVETVGGVLGQVRGGGSDLVPQTATPPPPTAAPPTNPTNQPTNARPKTNPPAVPPPSVCRQLPQQRVRNPLDAGQALGQPAGR
jgi:hypothetical protein